MAYQIKLPDGSLGWIDDSVPQSRALEAAKSAYPDAFPPPPGVFSQLVSAPKELVKGAASSLVQSVGGLGALPYAGARYIDPSLKPFEETGFGKKIVEAEKYFAPSDEGVVTQVAGGLGSVASMLGPQALLRGGIWGAGRLAAGLAPRAAMPVAVAQTSGLGIEEARQRVQEARGDKIDVTPGQELAALATGVPIGLTELLPVEKLMRGLDKTLSEPFKQNVVNYLKRASAQGGIEGLQEAASGLMQDLSAKGIYNPNLEVGKSMLEEAALGGAVGFISQAGMDMLLRKQHGRAYQQKQAAEHQSQLNEKLEALEREKAEATDRAAKGLGIINPQEVLMLPAPAPQVEKTEEPDPLMNPVGFFSKEELTSSITNHVNKIRRQEGKKNIDRFSIEDLVDAGAPQAEVDRLLTFKTGYDGTAKIEPQDVLNVAAQKNIDTSTVGFADFLRRTTGSEDMGEMSQPQLFSAFKALTALSPSEAPQILPPGTNATRFTEKQYNESIGSLKESFPKIGMMSRDAAVEAIKKSSGLQNDRDAESLLQTAIRNDDLTTVNRDVFELGIPGDMTSPPVVRYLSRDAADRHAQKYGLEVRERTHQDIALPREAAQLAGGPDIKQGTFKVGTAPQAFEIRSPEAVLQTAATQDEAAAKVARLEEIRKRKASNLLGQISGMENEIAKSQRKLELLEADGKANTIEYQKLSAGIAANNKNLQNRIDGLKKQVKSLGETLTIAPKGEKPVTKEGYTLFEQGTPVATFPNQQQAEEFALSRLPDDTLQKIANIGPTLKGLMPKRLAKMAEQEIQRRKIEGIQQRTDIPGVLKPKGGIQVKYTGTKAEAEARLAAMGIYTPEFNKSIKDLEKKLRPLMDRLGLKTLRLNIERAMTTPDGQAVDGAYVNRLITIAMDSVNPVRTLRHEGIHALKQLGAFTPDQWRVLENKAKSEWMAKYDIANRYKGQNMTMEAMLEEAIADAFSDFDNTKPPPGLVGVLFQKIKQFMEAFGNAMKGLGFQTSEDIFARAEAGGLKPIGEAPAAAPKFRVSGETADNAAQYSLRSPADLQAVIVKELGLSPQELAATSLGLQTGKGGTKAFKEQDIGGKKDIIKYLENRYLQSGLPKLDLNKVEDREQLSRLLSAEVLAAIHSGGANVEWYDKVIDRMMGMASLKYPELRTDADAQSAFRIAIAVSSQGQNVEDNLKFGTRVYEEFRQNLERGDPRFPEIGTGESSAAMKKNFSIANSMIQKMGMTNFRRFLETPFITSELTSAGLKTADLADEPVLGSAIFGPKIGFGFYSNLSGNFEPVTMDMWFMRTIGRLTGKLSAFRPDLYAQQIQEFRNTFDIAGDNGIYANQFPPEEIERASVDENAAVALARKVNSMHEKDFKNNRAAFDSEERVKSKLVYAAARIVGSLDGSKDAPANGKERRQLRDVVRRMREQVSGVLGQDIPPASLQAIIWYPEQELYKAMGAKLRVTSQNYANAMRNQLEKEGFDAKRISAAAQSGSRRARREDERNVAAGAGRDDRQVGRTFSEQEKQAFLSREQERVFFEKEAESPRAKTVIFEVAPSPDNVELTNRWNNLSLESKTRISNDVVQSILPKAMEAVGIEGYLAPQFGSYENETNPSFGLFVSKGTTEQIQNLAKMIGYALRQKSMVVASPKPAKGLSQVGAVRIEVGDISIEEADQIYQNLRGIRLNGEPIVSGQTTVKGNMMVLNFSELDAASFTRAINDRLENAYNVVQDEIYSNLIEEGEYNYADSSLDPRGSGGVLRQRSRTLRTEATDLLEESLSKAADRTSEGRGRDQRGVAPTAGEVTPKYSLRQTETPEFKRWFGDSKVVDAEGKPLVVYRGTRRVPKPDKFVTKLGRATTSWASDPAAASVYSRQLETGNYGTGSNVTPAFISMKNPLDLRELGETTSLGSVIGMLNWDFSQPSHEDGRVGWLDVVDALHELDKVVYKTKAKYDIEASDTEGYRVNDFEELADLISELGEQKNVGGIFAALHEAKIDVYALADSENFVEMLRRAGYDGVIHKDVFEVGARYYEGDTQNLAEGEDGNPVIDAYRPFDQTQIKSAIGNRGTFDPNNPDIRYSLRQTDTPEFKEWFGKSKIAHPKPSKEELEKDIAKLRRGGDDAYDVVEKYDVDLNKVDDVENYIRSFSGKPKIMYHGTARDITTFQPKQAGAIFVTDNPRFAEIFSENSADWVRRHAEELLTKEQFEDMERKAKRINDIDKRLTFIQNYVLDVLKSGMNLMPLYVRAENPFDYENPEHIKQIFSVENLKNFRNNFSQRDIADIVKGAWNVIESPQVQEAIKKAGFDSFYVNEAGNKNLGVFSPNQVKSAIGNIGAFSRTNNDIRYALALKSMDPSSPLVPNEGGNPDGILGMMPKMFGGKPIRMLIGTHNDVSDKGYGGNHILSRVMGDPRRMPDASAPELLERIVRTANNTAQRYNAIYNDGNNLVLYDGKNSLIISPRRDEASIVTMYVQQNPEARYGRPAWTGRTPPMPMGFVTPVRGMPVVAKEGRVAIKTPPVKVKRVYTPSEITEVAERSSGTLTTPRKFSIRNQLPQDVNDAIDNTTTVRREAGFVERLMDAISPQGFAKFRQGLINKYNAIENLSKSVAAQFGSNELLADTSAIAAALFSDRAAGVAAASFKNGVPVYRNGFTSVSDLNGSVKGLIPIFEPLMRYGDPFIFQAFQFYAGVKRGRRLTAEGREQLFNDPQHVRRAALLEANYPEFQTVFDQYQKYNKGLVDFMRDTGVISDREAQIWTQNWDYIPFYRQLEGDETPGPKLFSSISGVTKPKKLKGGEAPLADFMETVIRNSRAAIEAGMKNVASQRIVRDVVRMNMGAQVPAAIARGADIVTVKENGLTKHYRVDDMLLVESMKSLNLPHMPFLDIVSKPTELLRNLVTKDPGFILANLMRDSMQAWVTSGTNITPIVDTFKQYGKVLAGMSDEAKALYAAGLGGGYEFKGDLAASAKSVEEELRKRTGQRTVGEKAMLPLSKMWELLDKGSTASDVATRAEIYKRTLERTGNEAEALYQAMEIMNFSRKGSSALIRVVTSLVPFMNARIQGLDVLYRAGFGKSATENSDRMKKAFMVRSMTILGLSAMYWALASDTEEYKNAEQEVRDNYWIIGNVRIPIPFEIGTLFKVYPERILEYFLGRDTSKDLKDSIVRNITSTLAFNPIPQALLPAVENIANYSFFTGQPIIGRGMEDVADKFQATPSTSLLAQQLGKTMNYSPMKIDNLIRGYTGTLGTYAVMGIDAIMRNEGDPTKATMRMEQMPVFKRFYADPNATGQVSAYYELKKAVEESTRTINFLERQGNMKDLQEYLKDKGAKLQSIKPYIQALEKDMKSLREMKMQVQISKMDPDTKRDVLDNIRKAEVAMTARIQFVKKAID